MKTLTLRTVKLTGIENDLEQKQEARHIPIVSLKQMSDERWNELADQNRKVREYNQWLN